MHVDSSEIVDYRMASTLFSDNVDFNNVSQQLANEY